LLIAHVPSAQLVVSALGADWDMTPGELTVHAGWPSTEPQAPDAGLGLAGRMPYLALGEVYHPLWAAFPNNPTPKKSILRHDMARLV
jgi:hypothetical protein